MILSWLLVVLLVDPSNHGIESWMNKGLPAKGLTGIFSGETYYTDKDACLREKDSLNAAFGNQLVKLPGKDSTGMDLWALPNHLFYVAVCIKTRR